MSAARAQVMAGSQEPDTYDYTQSVWYPLRKLATDKCVRLVVSGSASALHLCLSSSACHLSSRPRVGVHAVRLGVCHDCSPAQSVDAGLLHLGHWYGTNRALFVEVQVRVRRQRCRVRESTLCHSHHARLTRLPCTVCAHCCCGAGPIGVRPHASGRDCPRSHAHRHARVAVPPD